MDDDIRISALQRADDDYRNSVSPHYDEILHEVTSRVAASGSIGKADIGALVLWKRISASTRWASSLNVLPEREVRRITAAAVEIARDGTLPAVEAAAAARRALVPLPGCRSGDALASALLTTAAPTRMAVYDRRAHKGLRILKYELANGSGRYGHYMNLLGGFLDMLAAQGHDWTPRRADTALYWLANNPGLVEEQNDHTPQQVSGFDA